jgi:hypothetical protein
MVFAFVFLAAFCGAPDAQQPSPTLFAGSWMGHWAYGPRQMFVIEALAGDRARLTYSSGSMGRRSAPREGGQGVVEGTVAQDGSLHAPYVNGAQVVFRLSQEGRTLPQTRMTRPEPA